MKNKIIIYLACLAGLILASSCSTHDRIMKRRYMKGYYVSKHERVPTASATGSGTREIDQHEVANTLSASLEPEKLNEPVFAYRTDKSIDPVTIKNASTVRTAPIAFAKRAQKPMLRMDQMLELKKPVASDSNGLSLFWIVILVILILWAIGFLAGGFGIGNLINLLLVVALVLLILWLLKII